MTKPLFRFAALWVVCLLTANLYAQSSLSVEKIMQDPKKMVGTSPQDPFWAEDGKKLYFYWNPKAEADLVLYSANADGTNLQAVDTQTRKQVELLRNGNYNVDFTKKLCVQQGDITLYDLKQGTIKWLTFTTDNESQANFLADDNKIVFRRNDNLFVFNLLHNSLVQVTNFKKGNPEHQHQTSVAETWLDQQQLDLFQIAKDKKEKATRQEAQQKADKPKYPAPIYIQDRNIDELTLSPLANFVTFRLSKPATNKRTIVHDYLGERGFAKDLPTRPKVGTEETAYEFAIYDIIKDTMRIVNFSQLKGIDEQALYHQDYNRKLPKKPRAVIPHGAFWSQDGKFAVLIIRSTDNKDRWIVRLNPVDGSYQLLDHQRNEAWIGGPGTEGWINYAGDCGFMPDNQHFWFYSEQSGYAHLYKVNVATGEKIALTQGNFEVREAKIARNGLFWYLTTSEVHPGEDHLYQLPINGGKAAKLTSLTGGHESILSPDEKLIAYRYSPTNKPWELYLQENKPLAKPKQVTNSTTELFNSYAWRVPQVISYTARDGGQVYGRLYRPNDSTRKSPAVLFVHGAGYLQNAHKHWSNYFREYLFHNLLADLGYTVLDIDYRGSAGYGSAWRTGIYRHMGGKDLTDHVDGAKLLVEKYNVDVTNIGIYGGSYGGFITLMALFKEGNTFKSGAALRSVTDWSHYNHAYTASILNTPALDSLAYTRSSPIYFAEGLKGNLLICHGVVDTNVHFQDVVRLSQRLIELGKDNWEMALYPVEDHAFTEPASWTDEYKRILKLFENTLKPKR